MDLEKDERQYYLECEPAIIEALFAFYDADRNDELKSQIILHPSGKMILPGKAGREFEDDKKVVEIIRMLRQDYPGGMGGEPIIGKKKRNKLKNKKKKLLQYKDGPIVHNTKY